MKLNENNLVLRGRDSVVKKHDVLGRIIVLMHIIGWLGLIASLVCFGLVVKAFSNFWAGVFVVVGFIIYLFIFYAFIYDRQCPYCRHFNCLTQIGWRIDKGSEQSSISKNVTDTASGAFISTNGAGFCGGEIHRTVNGVRTTNYYNINIKCLACGCVFKKSVKEHHDSY
ncbi:MAG: hypothetical protein ACI4XA_10275 [Oscillospiraceae bacterium]